jgi:hypothetical protein
LEIICRGLHLSYSLQPLARSTCRRCSSTWRPGAPRGSLLPHVHRHCPNAIGRAQNPAPDALCLNTATAPDVEPMLPYSMLAVTGSPSLSPPVRGLRSCLSPWTPQVSASCRLASRRRSLLRKCQRCRAGAGVPSTPVVKHQHRLRANAAMPRAALSSRARVPRTIDPALGPSVACGPPAGSGQCGSGPRIAAVGHAQYCASGPPSDSALEAFVFSIF